EKAAVDSGKTPISLVRTMIARSEVIGEVDAARDAAFTVHPGRGKIALVATVDVSHVGLESLLGGGDGTLSGTSTGFDAGDAAVDAPAIPVGGRPARKRSEVCEGERLALEHIEAPEVAGSIGNPTSRRACVRLPVGYAEHPGRRYPVIYALPG